MMLALLSCMAAPNLPPATVAHNAFMREVIALDGIWGATKNAGHYEIDLDPVFYADGVLTEAGLIMTRWVTRIGRKHGLDGPYIFREHLHALDTGD